MKEFQKALLSNYRLEAKTQVNKSSEIIGCPYFNSNGRDFKCHQLKAARTLKDSKDLPLKEVIEFVCNATLSEQRRKEDCPSAFPSLKEAGINSPYAARV